MLYRCSDCRSIFSEPKIIEDTVGYYGSAPYIERWNACPFCESTEIFSYYDYDEEDEFVESGVIDD